MIVVTNNVRDVRSLFSRIRREQLPFAIARTLTELGKGGRDKQQAHMRTEFTNRGRARWLYGRGKPLGPEHGGGLDVEFASKKDKTPKATVWISRDLWSKHEKGGIKRPQPGHDTLTMATELMPQKRVISRARRPGPLVRAGKAYKRPGGGGVWMTRGQGKGKQAYFEIKTARIEPRLDLEKTVTRHVRKRYEAEFEKRMRRALMTARPR